MALLSTQYRYCRVLVLCHWLCRDVVSAPVPSHDTQSHSDQHCSFSLWSSMSCCLSHRHWLVGWDLSNKASGWTGCHHDPGGWSALEPCGLRTEPPLGLKPEGSALQHWEAKKKKKKIKASSVTRRQDRLRFIALKCELLGQMMVFAHTTNHSNTVSQPWFVLLGLEVECESSSEDYFSAKGPRSRTFLRQVSRRKWHRHRFKPLHGPADSSLPLAASVLDISVHTWSPIVNLHHFRSLLSIVCVKDGCLSFFKSIVSTVRLQK